MAKPKPKATAPKPAGERAMTDQREKQKRGRSGEGADDGRGATDRCVNIARLPELLGKVDRD
jgi:hypothetical protein